MCCPAMSMTPKTGPTKQTTAPMRLGEYRAKRSFDETPEPGPESAEPETHSTSKSKSGDALAHPAAADARFVVHEHHATAAALGSAAGARRGAGVMGGAQRDPGGSQAQPQGDPRRGPSARATSTSRARSRQATTAPARSAVWDRGTYVCEKWRAGQGDRRIPRRAAAGPLRAVPGRPRRAGLDDPPDGPAGGPRRARRCPTSSRRCSRSSRRFRRRSRSGHSRSSGTGSVRSRTPSPGRIQHAQPQRQRGDRPPIPELRPLNRALELPRGDARR